MTSVIPRTYEGMRDWCWQHNQAAMEKGWRHWMMCRPGPNESYSVKTIVGDDAKDIWAMLKDEPLVPVKWDLDDIERKHRLAVYNLEHGVSPDVWMLWSQESRAAKRKARIDAELRERAA